MWVPSAFPKPDLQSDGHGDKGGGDLIEHRWIVSLYAIPAKLHLLRCQQRKDVKCSGVNRYGPVGPLCQR